MNITDYNILIPNNSQTILVVDDDPVNLDIMTSFLEEAHYTVLVAEDGEIGLQRAIYTQPNLIILDIMMPKLNGYETCSRLKQNEKTRNIPVIFVTALAAPEQKIQGLAVGAMDFISKPFLREEVLARIDIHVRLAETTRRLQESNNHLKTVFASLQDGVCIVDRAGKIISQNAAADLLCGDIDAVPATLNSCSTFCRRVIDECLVTAAPVQLVRKECSGLSGRRLIISITASPLRDGAGCIYGAVLLVRDETLLASLEQAVTKTAGGSVLVGESSGIREVHSLIADCAGVDTTVLILGESGTGKELVADLIHEKSGRRNGPFIKVNCGALTETLIESELFGHVSGAFTGATTDRVGRFQMAEGGTIFLDEIGDISQAVQVRLLRVLENRSYERIGESVTRQMNVRVIAATNADLVKKVAEGTFRKDLYYRLKVFSINLPPLRDRREDIPILIKHFIEILRPMLNKAVSGVSEELLAFCMAYSWDGNVRELRNVLEYAVVRTPGPVIEPESLPSDMFKVGRRQNPADIIRLALVGTGGNKSAAARTLGVDRKTLYRLLERYNIDI